MVNHTVIQGRLVDAPSCGQTNSGVDYANFRIAWSEKFKDKENKLFMDCKAFSGTAQFIGKFFGKGSDIVVEGKLNTEEWEKDGQKRSKIVLIIATAHFCGKRQDAGQAQDNTPVPQPVEVDTGELPF